MTAHTGGPPSVASSIHRAFSRHPISAYIVIAFGWAWTLTPLVSISVLFGLVALFGPAVAAIVVSRTDGSASALRRRITDWRSPARSYLMAIGIPFGIAAVALAAWLATGHGQPGLGSVSAIELLIFVLVIGEEIGWRGFLLPRLRERMSLPAAGLVTGVIWTAWHLPIYLAPGQGPVAFAVFAWWVLPLAIVMAFVAERARYGVLVMTVMHGTANVATVILLPGVDHTWTMLATGTAYLLLATTLVAGSRSAVRGPRSDAAPVPTKEMA
jgi:hypothetical protein